jgi:hypothetical protein
VGVPRRVQVQRRRQRVGDQRAAPGEGPDRDRERDPALSRAVAVGEHRDHRVQLLAKHRAAAEPPLHRQRRVDLQLHPLRPTVQRLDAAQRAGRLDAELDRLRRIPLLVCDEVGYIPFEPEAAALFYALVASRYERASMIVSSNKPFSAEIFGDAVAVAAMVDRLVHHAEIINLNGDSYRLKGRRKDTDQTQ